MRVDRHYINGDGHLFVMDDKTIVVQSKKRRLHIKSNKEIIKGQDVNKAILSVDISPEEFTPPIQLLFNLTMGV